MTLPNLAETLWFTNLPLHSLRESKKFKGQSTRDEQAKLIPLLSDSMADSQATKDLNQVK